MTDTNPDNDSTCKVCVIASDQRETERPKREILDELRRCGFHDDETFAIKLALEEALTNAVKHGNQCDRAKKITVRYSVSREQLVVSVRDEGEGFLAGDIPDPTTPDRLPLPSGRGIMLIRAYMDDVQFRDNGREVVFTKRRHQH
ncbi:MAG: ATP-binding protein [Phycisphaerae bacterium]